MKHKKCQKIRYRDEISAKFALSQCRRKSRRVNEKLEIRCYYCENCYGWHLTSSVKKEENGIN